MSKQRMLQFVTVDKEMPDKRPPDLRAHDFHEIYAEYAREKAAEQAGRCSQCGVPYCQTHCPLHNNIPDWLMLTAQGRLEEAPRSFVACVGRGNAELRHAGFEPIRFWRIRFWRIRFWRIRWQ